MTRQLYKHPPPPLCTYKSVSPPPRLSRMAPALLRDRLGPAATTQLARRVSLVDLASSGSESSGAAPALLALPAPALPPTVVLSGSEAESKPASVGKLGIGAEGRH